MTADTPEPKPTEQNETADSELPEREFPVLGHKNYRDCPRTVKWSELDDQWARSVHGQSLQRLAERGGLCPEEIYWNVHKLPWRTKVSVNAALDLVKKIASIKNGSALSTAAIMQNDN